MKVKDFRVSQSISELIEFNLYLLHLFEQLLQLHLVEVDLGGVVDGVALGSVGVEVERELDDGRTDILADDLALADLRMVEHNLVVLLHLRVVEGHVELPVEVLQRMLSANQLPFQLRHVLRRVLSGINHCLQRQKDKCLYYMFYLIIIIIR